ncbi:type 4a pilus biogenesis protein PilO [Candidatus Kaiserbacteria bacterium]|nr:type 4a pilus biogenesis protein PilO [Candidatus Kaiserbacteria bacterium]
MNGRLLPLLALGVAIAIFLLYVNPTWSGPIAATKAVIASDDEALAAANRYAAQQNQLASARNAIDPADLDRLSAFLPDSVNNVGIILDLNGLAARSGLSLENIDVTANEAGNSDNANPLGSADLSLSALGTYGALQNFLRGVERSRRLLDVQSISVKGSDTGVYTYKMALRLYWLR